VREVSHRISARSTASAIRSGDGSPTIDVRMLDPVATAPQKKSVAVVPKEVPTGTVKLLSRHSLVDQTIGSVHCSFVFGPVGLHRS
jgi:hypothetical protein